MNRLRVGLHFTEKEVNKFFTNMRRLYYKSCPRNDVVCSEYGNTGYGVLSLEIFCQIKTKLF